MKEFWNFLGALIVVIALVAVPYHLYRFYNGPEKPWYGYATSLASQKLEPWWIAYETRRDCLQETARLVASSPNNGHYQKPFGCTYMGDNFIVTWLINKVELRENLQCVTRFVNNTDDLDYGPKFAGYDLLEAGEGWYCM